MNQEKQTFTRNNKKVAHFYFCIESSHITNSLNHVRIAKYLIINKLQDMFKIKAYGKSEFAWMMFPKMRDPKAAQDKLLRWIKRNPRIHKKILKLATTKDDNIYTKEQIELIVDTWGEPGEYDDF